MPENLSELKPHMVFADPPKPNLRRKPKKEHRALNLALVADQKFQEHSPSPTYRSMFLGMQHVANRGGHHFRAIHIESDEFDASIAEHLAREIDSQSLDGCVVRAVKVAWIDTILDERGIPRTHFSDYRLDEIPHPCIMLDPADAVRSAVLRLHAAGCRRIGHLGLTGRFLAPGLHETFVATMAGLGLTAGRVEYLELDPQAVAEGVDRLLAFDKPADGFYVSDDVLLNYLAREWAHRGLIPGRDFSVITMACRGNPLPGKISWSRMEFNPYQVGRIIMDNLLQSIQTVEGEICSFAHLAAYRPGTTSGPTPPDRPST